MSASHPSATNLHSSQPGGLLDELERRQDDVLSQLDDLDAKLNDVLKGLEPESANPDVAVDGESADYWA